MTEPLSIARVKLATAERVPLQARLLPIIGRMASRESNEDVVRRQLSELLSELRVALPGVTVLFAFLLTLPFTSPFADLTATQDAAYYIGLLTAAIAAVLLISPSAMHRIQHGDGGQREDLVRISTLCAIAGSAFLLTSMVSSLFLAAGIVYDDVVASVSAGAVGALAAWLWFILPLTKTLRRRTGAPGT
jgi:hypothetical protein